MRRQTRDRLTDKDIYMPKADIPTEEIDRDFGTIPDRDVFCYTMSGKHDYLDEKDNPVLMDTDEEEAEDRDLTFAKRVQVKGGAVRYFIKQGPDGRLFNPLGFDEWTHNKTRHRTGEKIWSYHEVSPQAFSLYLKFLRTKNTAYHKNAEREAF